MFCQASAEGSSDGAGEGEACEGATAEIGVETGERRNLVSSLLI